MGAMIYKPQWAYPPLAADRRREDFLLPFRFTVRADGLLKRGFPWQLDDDVPWRIHGIVFPQIGTGQTPTTTILPGLCRIWDSRGNALSRELVLALGVWCQSGFGSINAFGFPIEPAIECEPGGVLTFDFQISTNATIALATRVDAATTSTFRAARFGTVGNSFSIQAINPGAPNVPLSVAVVGGTAVQVTLATDGGAALISTHQQVADIINQTAAAAAVLSVSIAGPTGQVMGAFGPTALAGGAASSDVELNGTLIGQKMFRECL